MKHIIVATTLALLSGCSALSGPGDAASGATTTGEPALYLQNPANSERSFSLQR
jgi:hypothetical protein